MENPTGVAGGQDSCVFLIVCVDGLQPQCGSSNLILQQQRETQRVHVVGKKMLQMQGDSDCAKWSTLKQQVQLGMLPTTVDIIAETMSHVA